MATYPSMRTRILLDKLIRIDHAKGLAAKYMYKGQLAVLNNKRVSNTLKDGLERETSNISKFEELIPKNRVRPSLLMPVWKYAAYAFGLTTAFLGEEAALTCKSAVETVIGEQYNHQIRELFADDPVAHAELLEILKQLRDKDFEGHNLETEAESNLAPCYQQLNRMVKLLATAGIKIAEKV